MKEVVVVRPRSWSFWGWLTWAGPSLWQVVEERVKLQAAQQRQAGATLLAASEGREGRGSGERRGQDVAEQSQGARHVALGQVHAH